LEAAERYESKVKQRILALLTKIIRISMGERKKDMTAAEKQTYKVFLIYVTKPRERAFSSIFFNTLPPYIKNEIPFALYSEFFG
jgi:hypothetical protein